MKSSRLLAIALLTLVAALATHKIYDPDFWMHLAAGQWAFAAGAVPRVNTFSFTYPEHPWLNVYWLYQIVLAGIWQWFGPVGIVVWRVALCLALLALVWRAGRTELTAGGAMCVLMGWLLLAPRLTDRPELVSYVLLAGMVVVALRRRWWWCVPLQIAWANVQGLFVLGPPLVALAGLGCWWRGQRDDAQRAWFVAVLLVGCSAVSPFGIRNLALAGDFWQTLTSSEMQVEELVSAFHPWARTADGTGWLLIVYAALVGVLFWRHARQIEPGIWLWTLTALPMALVVRRAIPVFVLCSLPGLLAVAPRLDTRLARWTVVGLCLLLAAGLRIRGQTRGVGVEEARFPVGAVEFLRAHETGPRVWNADFSTGGYLAAQGVAPLVDGRLEAYPRDFLRAYFLSETHPDLFAAMVTEFGVTHWLARKSELPATGADWSVVYEDEDWTLLGSSP